MDFMAFKNSIVAVDHEGRTVLYDCASRSILATNPMQPAVQSNNTFVVTVGDSLYAMSSEGCLPSRLVRFTALIYGKPPDFFGQDDDWYWRSLQLPPFEYADHCSNDGADCYSRSDAGFTDDTSDDDSTHPCAISAYTVVGYSQIWVSTVAAGTYSFDTVSRTWSKVGAWALPFRGRGVYRCTSPSTASGSASRTKATSSARPTLALTQAPVLHKVWQDPPPPEYQTEALILTAARLLPLGSGKLCVARVFDETEPDYGTFAVVTGVEVRRGASVGDCLLVVKHKSRHYSFGLGTPKHQATEIL
ncbi:hypothetical protein ACQ4PT_054330 [Festuca glaucescens]